MKQPSVRRARAASFTAVRVFCSRVPVFSPRAFVAVSTTTTRTAAPFAVHPSTPGARTPRNFENATQTAAIVPVWTTSAIVQP
jgi:hypothetical protein